ncbi:hypothetical protein JM16_007676, partial [Phytophthora kernoviae]
PETDFWVSQLADLSVIGALNSGSRVVDYHDGDCGSNNSQNCFNQGFTVPPPPQQGGRWPCGQLTAKGIAMMRLKGQLIREKYCNFISDIDNVTQVHVQSTNIRRTIRSAQSLLAGLFPEHFVNVDADNQLSSSGELLPAIREVLVCHQAHGLAFPDGLDRQLFAQICDYDAWLWHQLYGKMEFCRASFSAGVQRIYTYLSGIPEGTTTHKLSLFSAHDNSLVAFANALQLQVPRVIPPYGAMLIFEVFRHRVTGEFYLKTLFEDDEVTFARDLTLRHVLIFHRHGDRTPVLTSIGSKVQQTHEETDFWASKVATPEQIELLQQTAKTIGADPSQPPTIRPSKESQFPYGLLTQKGVEHMTAKGRKFRERYGDFMGGNVKTEDVHVLSSSVPRTIESVQSLLRGFFYEGQNTQIKVPQFYVHTYTHNVLAPNHPLQVFNEIELIVHDDVVSLRSKIERGAMEKLSLHLRECLGVPEDQPLSWTAVRDALTCREAHDWPFPEGVDQKIFEQVTVYDTWLWQRLYHRKGFCHGAFKDGVKEIYAYLKSVVNNQKEVAKLSFFSAHDNSIVALLGALQIDVGAQLPEYGTAVTFEVHEDVATHEFYIKPLYEGEVVSFVGHHNDPFCPFSHFESLALEFLTVKA